MLPTNKQQETLISDLKKWPLTCYFSSSLSIPIIIILCFRSMPQHACPHTLTHTHAHTQSDSLLAACWSKFIRMLISNKIWTFRSAVKRAGSIPSSQEVVFLQTPSLLASLYLSISTSSLCFLLSSNALQHVTLICASCSICDTSCAFLYRCVIAAQEPDFSRWKTSDSVLPTVSANHNPEWWEISVCPYLLITHSHRGRYSMLKTLFECDIFPT